MSSLYIALDLETTGLDTDRDAIIEIGAVKFRGSEVLGEFAVLVNPGRRLPAEIVALTGITDDDLVDAPNIQEVLPRLQSFVGDLSVIGHNVSFDLAFLRHWNVLRGNKSFDTFRLATVLVPEVRRYSLGNLAAHFGVQAPESHRALHDAYATQRLFSVLFERARSLPTSLLEELIKHGSRVEWPATRFFRNVLESLAKEPFTATAGQQFLKVGDAAEDGPMFAVQSKAQPLEPAQIREPVDVERLASLLEEGGAFDQGFPGFEYRPQQVEMLRAVCDAFNEGIHLMVEAPTGVGKSLAYLIPAVHWAAQNGERVVVSTNTINLQEQLYRKDLPELVNSLPLDFRASVLKGRSHYLCQSKLSSMRRVGPSSIEEMDVLARILAWLPTTSDGDGDMLFLPTAVDRAIWHSLSADNEGCHPDRCKTYQSGQCFFYRARKAAEAAHLVIINHALLLADVAVQNRALPEYNFLIVDEAHHLESATTRGLSFSVNQGVFRRLIEEVGRSRASGGFSGLLGETLARCRAARLDDHTMDTLEDFINQIDRDTEKTSTGLGVFFENLERFIAEMGGDRGGSSYAYRLRVIPALRVQPAWEEVEIAWDEVATPLFAVEDGLERLAEGIGELEAQGLEDAEELQAEVIGVARQLDEIHTYLNGFVSQPSHQTIYWAEVGPGNAPLSLHAAPLHVGPLVQEHLFHKKESVVLTSATLRTGGSFDYLRERLHAWDADEIAVDSPFDYESSTLVYLVEDIPEPGQSGYQQAVAQGMAALFRATKGRALALFTSYSQLRATARAVTAPLGSADITVFAQGRGFSRNQLLENFKTTERAVLLGTRSFWEGVDVPGEALSCLAIAKLPFNVPSDPIFAARAETFEDAFLEYAVPEAVLRFLQGFGRLIRTRTDRGIVVVFDRRLLSKAYGEYFLDSLPGPTISRGPLTKLPKIAGEWLEN